MTGNRNLKKCDRKSCADIQVSEKGDGGGAPGTTAEICLHPVVKTVVKLLCPWGYRDPLQPGWDSMPEQGHA